MEMSLSRIRFLRRWFAFVGFVVISSIVAIALLEFGAFLVLSTDHWIRHDSRDFAESSPAYAEYSWAPEYWKEEKARWKLQHSSYEPFVIWGAAPWHSKYINTDATPQGIWRRTINTGNAGCEKQNSVEVLMFGGSTLYGTGVPDEATLPSFLSRELNSAGRECFVVSNFGVEGYVTNQEIILLIEQLKAGRRPGIVIFYDGVNDSFAGTISPGTPNAHVSLANIKARVEGSVAGRIDFLCDSNTLQLVMTVVNWLGRVRPAGTRIEEIGPKVSATLDNYETNLRMAKILGEAYGFRLFCFWQPALVYGHKPLHPFEMKIANNAATKSSFRILAEVYQKAEEQSASSGSFVFLGDIFDTVKEPLYIDKWMHLDPDGNELVARSIAKYLKDGLDVQSGPTGIQPRLTPTMATSSAAAMKAFPRARMR
jgi:lysophospholipase L1-like esterase